MGKKPKKQKVIYVDDGRTIADMSGVRGSVFSSTKKKKKTQYSSGFKDKWNTYWDAVKMMFLPMLVVVGILCLLYMIMWLIMFLSA